MKLSDIRNLADDIQYYLGHELNSGIHFGCDCGCGGDYYSEYPEQWDEMCEEYDELCKRIQEECDRLGIENDLF